MSEKADLERLSVLIVEDNSFIRDLLSDVMRSIGIGRIFTAEDGRDAIELLQTVATDPLKAGISVIDIVISDVYMPSLDGRMLLRWIRTSSKSPDRFVPTLMISGAADRDIVRNCRDLGASEFLAKPFSATIIADKILHTIMRPRKFILGPTYFGPERRRTELFQDTERRLVKKEDIQIIHSDKPPKAMRDDAQVIHFVFRNRLSDKIGAYNLKGVPEIDMSLIEQAEKKIEGMAGDYADWVSKSIRQLARSLKQLQEGEGDSKEIMEKLNILAHEFRGQGGIFGYPLVTKFGKSLYDATLDVNAKITPSHVDFFKAHVDAINAVMNEKIKGNGGEIGKSLLEGLEQAQANFAEKSSVVS
ncbi:MAG: response regulator [Alphaproteobacteria bacterium]|jgi:CheY-like chemotaxis protein|nr:response regulator [Alphaproteobacteria bacterium]MBT4083571.1 response regulator [Alphaproteobacteria bacterium]MBT4545375.1 response regulator [Alphaproteobacteria bacterium]